MWYDVYLGGKNYSERDKFEVALWYDVSSNMEFKESSNHSLFKCLTKYLMLVKYLSNKDKFDTIYHKYIIFDQAYLGAQGAHNSRNQISFICFVLSYQLLSKIPIYLLKI